MMDFWMVVLMLIWGTNYVILKSSLEVIPAMVFNSLRFGAATLMLGILFKANGYKLTLPRREWPIMIWLAFQGSAIYQLLFLNGLRNTTVVNSSLLLTTMPVWVVLFNALRGHERLSKQRIIGVVVALFGVVVVILGGKVIDIGGKTLLGDVLTLAASLVWASTTVTSYKPYNRNPTPALTFWGVAWGAAFQALFALPDVIHLDWSVFSPSILLAIAYSGIVSIGVGYIIWNHGVKTLGTGRPAIYTYLEPAIAGIAAVIFLNEPLTPWLIGGAVLVLCGVIFVQSG
jgi:drug/metabolite transporter (DMT)-like permease